MQLSKKVGIPQSVLARWELKQSEPRASDLIILAEFFDVSVDELLGRKDYL